MKLTIALGGLVLVAPLAAQHPNPASFPGTVTPQSFSTSAQANSASTQEKSAALAFGQRAIDVLKRDVAAANSAGYLTWVTPFVWDDDRSSANPTARFKFGVLVGPDFWWWSANQHKMMNSAEMGRTGGSIKFDIVANSLDCVFHTNGAGADTVGALYEAPRRIHDPSGVDVYTVQREGSYDSPSCGVLTNSGRPLWVPVSRERYLRVLIARAKKDVSRMQHDIRANSPKAQATDQRQQAAEMGKAMAAMCDQVKKSSPSQYNDCVAQATKAQKQLDSVYRALASDPRMDDAMRVADTAGNGRVRELEAQLSSMPAADRAKPAVTWRADTANALPWSFLPRRASLAAPESLATPIVEPNHAFFDATVARSAPQIITIEMNATPSLDPRIARVHDHASCVAAFDEDTCHADTDNPEFAHCQAEYREEACLPMRRARIARKLLDGFDWAGLRALLKP